MNLPTFIDVIGFDDKLSTNQEECLANNKLLNLIINGKLPENCDLLDLGKIYFMWREKVQFHKRIKEIFILFNEQ